MSKETEQGYTDAEIDDLRESGPEEDHSRWNKGLYDSGVQPASDNEPRKEGFVRRNNTGDRL